MSRASLTAQEVKNPPAMQETQESGFDPEVGEVPWRRKQQPAPGFLPGKSRGQRSLMGYNPKGQKESDNTEKISTHTLEMLTLELV